VGEHELDDVLPAAALGEAWALRAVDQQLSPRVHAYLRARGASEPEDLTSEVFLAVLPRIPTVTGGGAGLTALAFSVARARLVDELRRRGRRGTHLEFRPSADPRASASAEEEATQALRTQAVAKTLAQLPDDQRDVLLMRIVGDLTVEQVAEAIGRTPGAVKQLQRRGLLALRALVAEGRVPL
jgi:RNA polymerase sigma-70 factor (ECF subfamily)